MKSMQHLEKKYQCIESDKVSGLTVVMDVDTFKNLVKQNHPLLAQLQDNEDKDLIAKIKVQEVKQALKNEIALNILRLLAQYKAIDETP